MSARKRAREPESDDMDSDEREALEAFAAEGFDPELEQQEAAAREQAEARADQLAAERALAEKEQEARRQAERLEELAKAQRPPAPHPRVFMDLTVADYDSKADPAPLGRLVFELFINSTPRTVENFRALCTGEAGFSRASGVKLHYQGSLFHRIVPGFVVQAGDLVLRKDGVVTDGLAESIFGGAFEDESFTYKHSEPGVLSMANAGADTNTSQFFVTLGPAPHLDNKHVVFGQLVNGMEVLRKIEKYGRKEGDPRARVAIARCGEISTNGNEIRTNQVTTGAEVLKKKKFIRQ